MEQIITAKIATGLLGLFIQFNIEINYYNMVKRLTQKDILRCSNIKRNNDLVKKHYSEWRHQTGLPDKCDISECYFSNKPLVWNGMKIVLILDHKNGNNCDNRVINLRYLCPNCNSQQITHGGKNKGRVIRRSEIATSIKNFNGGIDVIVYL